MSDGIEIKDTLSRVLTEMMEAKTLEKIEEEEIASKAGITLDEFQSCFKDKRELLAYKLKENTESVTDALIQGRISHAEATRQRIQHFLDNKDYYKAFASFDTNFLFDAYSNIVLECNRRYAGKDYAEFAARYCAGGQATLVLMWINNGMEKSVEQMAQAFDAISQAYSSIVNVEPKVI